MPEKLKVRQPDIHSVEHEPVSWWNWRSGLKPGRALLLGGVLTLLALVLAVSGLTTLIAGLLDSTSAPVRVPGIVTAHSKGILGEPQLTIRLHTPGLPSSITLVMPSATAQRLTNGTTVLVDYGLHLHAPYALESGGHLYPLAGTSVMGNLVETLLLLLFGLVLLPYPFLLALWGWLDLHAAQARLLTASVVALRSATQTTTRAPGLIPRVLSTWHGVALKVQPPGEGSGRPEILTFGISQALYDRLHLGDTVEAVCSLHLRYLYTLKRLEKV